MWNDANNTDWGAGGGRRWGVALTKPGRSGTASNRRWHSSWDLNNKKGQRHEVLWKRIWTTQTQQLQGSPELGIFDEQKENAASLFFPVTMSKYKTPAFLNRAQNLGILLQSFQGSQGLNSVLTFTHLNRIPEWVFPLAPEASFIFQEFKGNGHG